MNEEIGRLEIAASAMCFDWKNLNSELIELIENKIDYLHFDFIDGVFAPDFGMGTSIVNSIREGNNVPADYHLMVENPSRIFDTLTIRTGDLVTIHQEACKNLHRDLINLRKLGARVAVAINPGTHIDSLDYILEEVDQVLVMTVNPGFKGQQLVQQAVTKILHLQKKIEKFQLSVKIGVDGNVNNITAPLMIQNGARFLVGGSSGLFRRDTTISNSIKELRRLGDG
jgi:ribulose-phosphate 3-epimerase